MAEHETCLGASDDWYTPPAIFDTLGLTFDLDPCSPGAGHWVPARKVYTIADDELAQPWSGLVFMNPPFGGRNGHVPWMRRFLEHGDGIAIVRAYTSSAWFHDWATLAETMLFPRGKTNPARRSRARCHFEKLAPQSMPCASRLNKWPMREVALSLIKSQRMSPAIRPIGHSFDTGAP